MSNIPADLKYTKSHECINNNENGTITVGITDHAQELLGDLVFVELPEVGKELEAGEPCAVVESVKAASDIYAPIAGEVVEVNEALEEEPELINSDPYGDGWLFKLKLADDTILDGLLSSDEYTAESDDE
jgi:glycine cleavage system H protein